MWKAVFSFLLKLLEIAAFFYRKREVEKPEREQEKFDKAIAEKDTDTLSGMLSDEFDRLHKDNHHPR